MAKPCAGATWLPKLFTLWWVCLPGARAKPLHTIWTGRELCTASCPFCSFDQQTAGPHSRGPVSIPACSVLSSSCVAKCQPVLQPHWRVLGCAGMHLVGFEAGFWREESDNNFRNWTSCAQNCNTLGSNKTNLTQPRWSVLVSLRGSPEEGERYLPDLPRNRTSIDITLPLGPHPIYAQQWSMLPLRTVLHWREVLAPFLKDHNGYSKILPGPALANHRHKWKQCSSLRSSLTCSLHWTYPLTHTQGKEQHVHLGVRGRRQQLRGMKHAQEPLYFNLTLALTPLCLHQDGILHFPALDHVMVPCDSRHFCTGFCRQPWFWASTLNILYTMLATMVYSFK